MDCVASQRLGHARRTERASDVRAAVVPPGQRLAETLVVAALEDVRDNVSVARREPDLVVANRLLSALPGMFLSQLCVGVGDLQMNFTNVDTPASTGAIAIEGRIAFEVGEHIEHHDAPALGGIGYLLPLLNEPLESAQVLPDASLRLVFASMRFAIQPDEKYESWTFGVAKGSVYCTAGGRLDIFLKRAQDEDRA